MAGESRVWDSWSVKIAGSGIGLIAAAMIGAHTDLIRALPQIVPRVEQITEEVRAYRAGVDRSIAALEGRVSGCEVWQVRHDEYATTNSRELHEGVARNSAEIEKLRERIDRALERPR